MRGIVFKMARDNGWGGCEEDREGSLADLLVDVAGLCVAIPTRIIGRIIYGEREKKQVYDFDRGYVNWRRAA